MHFVLVTEIDFNGFQSLSAFLIHAETLSFLGSTRITGDQRHTGSRTQHELEQNCCKEMVHLPSLSHGEQHGARGEFRIWMQRVRVPNLSWLRWKSPPWCRSVDHLPRNPGPRLCCTHGSHFSARDESRFSEFKLQNWTLASAKHQKTWRHLEI